MLLRWVGLVAIAAASVAAAGCSGQKACGAVGAYSGVVVTVPAGTFSADGTDASAPFTMQACAATACAQQSADQLSRSTSVVLDAVHSGRRISVSVSIRSATGTSIASATTQVAPTKFQPNGPGCDPTVWQARVTVRSATVLTPT
jgi:hypothetical protein